MLKTDGIDAPHRHQSYSIENRSLIVLCVLWLVIKNIMCIFFYLNVHEIKIQLNSYCFCIVFCLDRILTEPICIQWIF